ncbi:MAG: D-alanyl-D-alanine carboxypeptidase, partial [Gammaproteobacteria bacterium]
MKVFNAFFACCLALWGAAAFALQATPEPPLLDARAYALMDFHSGQFLAEKDADTPIEPASLTKIMTVYVALHEIKEGRLSLDDPVTVSEKAWRTGGSKMFIEVGKQVPVKDLLLGIIVQSGNDACVALAEHIAGSEEAFAALMNQYAKALGLKNTHFVNSTGLPHPDHHTTARDLAILTQALIREFPEEYKWFSIKKFTYNGITQYNRNKLLWRDPTVDGVKTGHTQSAGYCLVASAKR